MTALLLGVGWTIGAAFIAYAVAIIAGLSGGMSWSGVGRMFAAGIVAFAVLEIAGFYVIGAIT